MAMIEILDMHVLHLKSAKSEINSIYAVDLRNEYGKDVRASLAVTVNTVP